MQQFDISVSAMASSEISLAYSYHNSLQEGLGEQFLTAVDEVFAQIAHLPSACPVRYQDVHAFCMRQYPYHIYYRIVKKRIRIIAFFYQRSEPVAMMAMHG